MLSWNESDRKWDEPERMQYMYRLELWLLGAQNDQVVQSFSVVLTRFLIREVYESRSHLKKHQYQNKDFISETPI